MTKLKDTRVFVTLIVSVDGAKGGHRQFNTVLHGLNDIERVIGQTAAGIVEAEITRLAVQQDRYDEYVETMLKCSRAADTNKPEETSPGPAGQTAKAGEGATGREAPTGAGGSSTEIGGSPALPDDGARSSLSRELKLEWYMRRCSIAESLLRDDKPIEREVDVLVYFTLAGTSYRKTVRVPAGSDNVPLGRPFLLEIRSLCSPQLHGLRAVRPLVNRLHWSDGHGRRPGEKPCGNIVCEDQVIGGWTVT